MCVHTANTQFPVKSDLRCQICGNQCSGNRWLAHGGTTYYFCNIGIHTAHDILVWFSETILCQKLPYDMKDLPGEVRGEL